jgi:hypothetical protein
MSIQILLAISAFMVQFIVMVGSCVGIYVTLISRITILETQLTHILKSVDSITEDMKSFMSHNHTNQ